MGRGKFTNRCRVGYSSEGVRVLCTKPVYGFSPADPARVGVFLGMVTEKVGRVLWDDRRSPQYLHIDYLESAPASLGTHPGAEPAVAAKAPALSSQSATPPADDASSRRVCGEVFPCLAATNSSEAP